MEAQCWQRDVHEHQGGRLITCNLGYDHLLVNMLSLLLIGDPSDHLGDSGLVHSSSLSLLIVGQKIIFHMNFDVKLFTLFFPALFDFHLTRKKGHFIDISSMYVILILIVCHFCHGK